MEGEKENSNRISGEVIISENSDPKPPVTKPIEDAPVSDAIDTSTPLSKEEIIKSQSPKLSLNSRKIINIALLLVVLIILSGGLYFAYKTIFANKNSSPNNEASPTQNEVEPTIAITTTPQFKTYSNQNFGLSFSYPSDFYGPDVYESDSSLRLEIGTDVVAPYGSDRQTLNPQKKNSYYITITYTKNSNELNKDDYTANNPWLKELLAITSLNDGEEMYDLRSKKIKVRNITNSGFTGAEFISTLSETAQTEMTYSRNVLLLNDNYDSIRIMGTPVNVEVPEDSDWMTEYKKLDEMYLNDFRSIIDSIKLTTSTPS